MERAIWYLKRLAVMGPRELAHRCCEQLQVIAMRRAHRRGTGFEPDLDTTNFSFCNAAEHRIPAMQWEGGPDANEAEALLSGVAPALGYAWAWRDKPGVWHRAPDTGRVWPSRFFADISYRIGNPHGDVRVIWEPSRLQHLVALALLARRAADEHAEPAIEMIEAQLRSWLADNPHMTGVHYISAMECGLRLIAVCHALDMVRERMPDRQEVWRGVLSLVASHAPFICRRLSLYSSSGNHTIAEATGLVYAGTLFPEFEGARDWKTRGLELLQREAARQVLPDGGGIERAFSYHRFVLDLLALAAALLAHHGATVPDSISDAIARGRHFLAGLEVRPGLLPPVGDGDGGHALSPYLAWRSSTGSDCTLPSLSFPDSGYTVLRMNRERIVALFDHGPLGMAPGYGHAHADALSMTVYWERAPLLVDPGTFTYTADWDWRRYFRGTRAHNTVEVDGQDQAQQETPFQWSRPYRCKLLRKEEGAEGQIRLLAWHDGYRRLGIAHWRGIVCLPGRGLLIWDQLDGNGERQLALHWHCAVVPVAFEGGFRLAVAGRELFLEISGGATIAHRGSVDPLLGWTSPVYGVREPITTFRTDYCGALPHEFMTILGVSTKTLTAETVHDEIGTLRDWARAG